MPYLDIEKKREQHRRWKKAGRHRAQSCVLDYLKTHPCVDCGERDPLVLDFDHRNPADKSMGISDMVTTGRAVAKIQLEIEKCDIRCANCHRRKHLQDSEFKKIFTTDYVPRILSPEGRENIRQSKLGIARSEETKAKISESLKGNHCRAMHQLAGQKFGRLTVLNQWEKHGGRIAWLCRCDCGSPAKWIKSIKLTTGNTQSCGCLRGFYYGNGRPNTPIIENSGNARTETRTSDMGADRLQACSLD